MNRYFLTTSFLISTVCAFAQESSGNIQPVKLGDSVYVTFGGFARADYFVDSRKGKEAIDGLFYLWPEAVKPDANGNDLNKRTNQNLSATATRFSALFGGPRALKAKASAYFEFDFTGGNSNYLLFRQGWVKLNWTKASLQIGRAWHPLQGPVVPSTVSLNYGAPFNVFCRGEQVRFIYKPGAVSFLAATFWQAGHASFGPNTTNGDAEQNLRFMRNSMLPDLNFQIHYAKGNFLGGIMAEYKSLLPRESTKANDLTYKTDEKVNSYALAAFGQYKIGYLTVKGNAMYGQNLAEMMMQGGYASVSADPETGYETYSTSSAFTSWFNIVYGDKLRFGLFGGYQKNLGFNDDLNATAYKFYGRNDNIGSIYRVAPSVSYFTGRMVFQIEGEMTTANYGTPDFDDKGSVSDTKAFTNNRLTCSVSYYF